MLGTRVVATPRLIMPAIGDTLVAMKPNPFRGTGSFVSRPTFRAALVLLALFSGAARSPADVPGSLRQELKATPFKIAWEAYDNGNSDIYVANADGSNPVNITNTPTIQEHYPRISPDGKKLCVTIDTGEGRDAVRSLWLMDIDGHNRTKVSDYAREPFWSPDSKVLGYLPQEYPKFDVIDYYTKGLVYYHVDTGVSEPHPNSAKLRHLYHSSFAPNGKWIAAVVHGGMGFSHTIVLIGAHDDQIINLKIPGCRPDLCPDGKHIAWGSDDHEVDAAPLDLDAPRPVIGKWNLRIRDDKNKIYHITWSPDARFVSFDRGPDGEGDLSKPGTFQAACEIVGVYAGKWNLYVARANQEGTLDVTKATEDQMVALTTNGCSNKESNWFWPNRPVRE